MKRLLLLVAITAPVIALMWGAFSRADAAQRRAQQVTDARNMLVHRDGSARVIAMCAEAKSKDERCEVSRRTFAETSAALESLPTDVLAEAITANMQKSRTSP